MAGEQNVETRTDKNGFRPRNVKNGNRKWNGRRFDRKRNADAKPERTNRLDKVIEDIGKTLAAFSRRLEIVENRGPDRHPERQSEAKKPKAGPLITQRSNNDDFAAVSKSIYRMVQVRHHESNWQQLPKSIDDRLSKLATDIKPPMTDKYLESAIQAATKSFGETITNIVQSHLQKKRCELDMAAAKLNPVDVDQAKTIADKYLANRLGKRLTADRRATMVDDAVKKIGSSMPARSAATAVATDATAVAMDADGYQMVRRSPHGRKAEENQKPEQTADRPKRKADASPVQVSNRYGVLASMEGIDQIESDVESNEESRRGSPNVAVNPTPQKKLKKSDYYRTPWGVNVYTGNKDEWTIQPKPETRILVVGDSNLRDSPEVPVEWEIHSLPGAKLEHVTKMLRRMKTILPANNKLNGIVIQVGINHRSSFSSLYKYEMRDIIDEINEMDVQSSYCGVAISSSKRPMTEIQKVNEINAHAKKLWQSNYIDALPETEVVIKNNDIYGTHYTRDTIRKVIERIYNHCQSVF